MTINNKNNNKNNKFFYYYEKKTRLKNNNIKTNIPATRTPGHTEDDVTMARDLVNSFLSASVPNNNLGGIMMWGSCEELFPQ